VIHAGGCAGIAEPRKALRIGTFQGWGGVRVSAEPDSAIYWVRMLIRAIFILLTAAIV